MTAIKIKAKITLDEFLQIPETKPASEYIDGTIEQKPMPQGEHSILQTRLVTVINEVVVPSKLAHAFTELRCTFGGRSVVPDISVFTWHRIPKTERAKIANRIQTYPDWVIEILSPEQSANKVIRKIIFCLNQGTELGWLIDPQDESIMIFRLNQFPEVKLDQDILPVLGTMKDFNLSAKTVFSWLTLD